MKTLTLLCLLVFTACAGKDKESAKAPTTPPTAQAQQAPKETIKLTLTQSIAAQALVDKLQAVQRDMQSLSNEICDSHKWTRDSCIVNPQDMTVNRMK